MMIFVLSVIPFLLSFFFFSRVLLFVIPRTTSEQSCQQLCVRISVLACVHMRSFQSRSGPVINRRLSQSSRFVKKRIAHLGTVDKQQQSNSREEKEEEEEEEEANTRRNTVINTTQRIRSPEFVCVRHKTEEFRGLRPPAAGNELLFGLSAPKLGNPAQSGARARAHTALAPCADKDGAHLHMEAAVFTPTARSPGRRLPKLAHTVLLPRQSSR